MLTMEQKRICEYVVCNSWGMEELIHSASYLSRVALAFTGLGEHAAVVEQYLLNAGAAKLLRICNYRGEYERFLRQTNAPKAVVDVLLAALCDAPCAAL